MYYTVQGPGYDQYPVDVFAFNGKTGMISVLQAVDREEFPSFTVSVNYTAETLHLLYSFLNMLYSPLSTLSLNQIQKFIFLLILSLSLNNLFFTIYYDTPGETFALDLVLCTRMLTQTKRNKRQHEITTKIYCL